ncbi:thiamine phosphate synthase [Terrilactibacillus sp. S3-3]|nr:thiamine phosphate synthase [Terrilactibacillus sp. S3-3]
MYHQVPFIINDRVDIALAMNADGVHVGQDDLSAGVVRGLIGEEKILGVSAATVEEAIRAAEKKDGADYLGVGAVFHTDSKKDASYTSLETLKAIREAVSIPIVAIGGISEKNIEKLYPAKVDGVAVISAILSQKNVQEAAERLLEKTAFFNR